jgi:hypothetical protein
MLYKPGHGKMKDFFIACHDGRYHLFSMYSKTGKADDRDYRNIWHAESDDGVHWRDAGCAVEDFDYTVYAQAMHKVGNTYFINAGSFDDQGNQNRLKFWESTDMKNWKYLGKEKDLTSLILDPSGKTRLDCMIVIKHKGVWYGYASGPRPFLKSADGYNWEFLDTKMDFQGAPEPPAPFETGGCLELNGSFYYFGAWFNFLGRFGYSTCCFRSSSPEGPFMSDPVCYRLTGNSTRWVYVCTRDIAFSPEPLVSSYMNSEYSYEQGDVWLPPLKKAETDVYGHLRLKYWQGNDRLLGEDRSPGKKDYEIKVKETWAAGVYADLIERGLVLCPVTLDAEEGAVISGIIETDAGWGVPSSVGFFLEESENSGTMIWLHNYGKTEIGYGEISEKGGKYSFAQEDVIDYGCSAPAGILPGKSHSFRLLVHKTMFELYLDDYYIQTFNTVHFPDKPGLNPRRIGFLVCNGVCRVTGLTINAMEGI